MGKSSLSASRQDADSAYSLSATLDKYEVKEITLAQAAKVLGKGSDSLSRATGVSR